MSIRIVNFIIVFSLVGIIILFGIDMFKGTYSKKNNSVQPTLKAEALSPTPIPNEPIECSGPYIAYEKGAQWTYTLTTNNPDHKPVATLLYVELVDKEKTKMIFETSQKNNTKTVRTTVQCTLQGIRGIPIGLFQGSSIAFLSEEVIQSVTNQLQIIPNKKMNKGATWNSGIDISSMLPIKIKELSPALKFIITHEDIYRVKNATPEATIRIKTNSSNTNSIDMSSFVVFEYELAENIGITQLKLQVQIPSKGATTLELKLSKYVPGKSHSL